MEHPEKKTSIPHILDSTTILSSRLGKKNSQYWCCWLLLLLTRIWPEKSRIWFFGQTQSYFNNCLINYIHTYLRMYVLLLDKFQRAFLENRIFRGRCLWSRLCFYDWIKQRPQNVLFRKQRNLSKEKKLAPRRFTKSFPEEGAFFEKILWIKILA